MGLGLRLNKRERKLRTVIPHSLFLSCGHSMRRCFFCCDFLLMMNYILPPWRLQLNGLWCFLLKVTGIIFGIHQSHILHMAITFRCHWNDSHCLLMTVMDWMGESDYSVLKPDANIQECQLRLYSGTTQWNSWNQSDCSVYTTWISEP